MFEPSSMPPASGHCCACGNPTDFWGRVSEFFILVAIVVAPLNFGSTRVGGIALVAGLFLAAFVAWGISLLHNRRTPQLPKSLVAMGVIILIASSAWSQGALTPTASDAFTTQQWAKIESRWPASILHRTGTDEILFYGSVFLALLVVADRARRGNFGKAAATTMVGTAVVVSLIAFAQNLMGVVGIYGESGVKMVTNFCGPFYHHTTAGAFFNITWPLALGLAWGKWGTKRWAAIGFALAGAIILAAHTTEASRMPPVVAAAGFLVMVIGLPRQSKSLRTKVLFCLFWVAAALAVVLVFPKATKTQQIVQRWESVRLKEAPATPAKNSEDPLAQADTRYDLIAPTQTKAFMGVRGEGWVTAVKAIGAKPLTGHGPANWTGAASVTATDPFIRTFFQYIQFVHNDFLQFWVEWGLIAGSALAGLLVIPFVRTVRRWKKLSAWEVGVWIGLGLVMVQALWDFPLQIPSLYGYASVLAAILWGGLKKPAEEAKKENV